MSDRLNQEREATLQPQRMASCKKTLEDMGFEVKSDGHSRLDFSFKGSTIMLYPYSGWHSGKTINDGRGFNNLVKQLKEN